MLPLTITLSTDAAALIGASARGLADVKRDAVRRASAAERARHRAELREIEAVIVQSRCAGEVVRVTGTGALLRELAHDAALGLAERLATALAEPAPPRLDLAWLRRAAASLVELLDTLARMNRPP